MSLSLASLNLHAGRDRASARYDVAAAIAALGTDVVVVQENWRPAGERSLAERAAVAGGYAAYAEIDVVTGRTLRELGVAEDDSETGAWGLAIMSRVPWRSLGALALSAAPGDVVGVRRAIVAEIPAGDGLLRVAGTHLTHRLVHGPAQLARLRRALAGSDVPTVIAGDLNMCRPTVWLGGPYRPVLHGRSWPAHRPVAQIDHVLAGPGVTVTGGEVGPAVGSDHLPVRVTLAVAHQAVRIPSFSA
ncbi:endonuclease/exonuclease/phosphatase family protein [Actinoplanes sp. RD1]|uniref:endonuclease/exonuclease/phosphatase family protein n=1 Tax=Actinoplanes sp. RD1 TaxID=3064538 RepID=UPI002740CC9C|nr:endonuclease/exonuclease/phosphatase family protein [Actinoplanes sp. RD1]